MSGDIISLKWKYLHANLVTSLNDGFTNFDSADVTLVSDDQIPFQAHKFVLSASSPVLKDLFLDNPSSHPLIYLKGVNQQDLCSILQFMYFGEASINQNRINQFLNNARDLQIKKFADYETGNDIEGDGNSEIFIEKESIENTKNLDNHEYESSKSILS